MMLLSNANFAGGPVVHISGKLNDTVCFGTVMKLKGGGANVDELTWSVSPNATISTSNQNYNAEVSFPTPGEYTITLVAYDFMGRPGGCTKQVKVLSSYCIDSNNVTANTHNTINFYPNPSTGEVNFTNLEDNLNYDLWILNSAGENLLHSNLINQKSIYLTFEAGIYFIKIIDENGKHSSGKLVLSK